MKGKLILILFILFPAAAYSASQKITWEPVTGAWGYNLEIKDSTGNVVVNTSVRENYFSVSKLEPGSYSFRISTLNILKQKGESTRWLDFAIEKLYIPELKSVSQRELLSSFLNKNITVTGNNLKPGGKFYLRGNGKELEITDTAINSDNEAVFSYKPDPSSKGIYDLVIVNRGDAESVLKNAIEILDPASAETICYFGAGYMVNVPAGTWSKYFAPSYTGADIFFQFSGRNIGFENTLFEINVDAVRYNNIGTKNKSTLTYTSAGIGAGYYYPFISNSIELFLKFGGGGVYTSLMLDESLLQKKITSIDPFVAAGAGFRAYLSESFFVDPACGWKTVFYKGTYLHDITLSLSCGFKF